MRYGTSSDRERDGCGFDFMRENELLSYLGPTSDAPIDACNCVLSNRTQRRVLSCYYSKFVK